MISSFVQQIKSHLPDACLPWVAASLREEPLIWGCLQDSDFQQRLFSQPMQQPEAWSPANLALLAINLPAPSEGLAADRLKADLSFPLDVGIRRRAAKAYESVVAGNPVALEADVEEAKAIVGLARAGLVALALRERRRLVGNWQGLRGEVTVPEQWRAPLACLYGIIPDPLDMLQALVFPGSPNSYHRLVLHILLSQPLAPEALKENVKSLLTRLSLPDKVNLLAQFSRRRLELATCLANELLPLASNPQPALPVHDSLLGYSENLKLILLQVEANQLADQPEQVSTYLNAAWEASFRLQAELASRVSDGARNCGDFASALPARQQAIQLAPGNPYYQADLAMALFEAGQTGQAMDCLGKGQVEDENGTEIPHPSILLATVNLAMQATDRERARQAALQLLQYLEAGDVHLTALLQEPREERAMFFVQLFLELDMPDEAVRACQRLLAILPDHLGLLILLGEAYARSGNLEEAASTLQLASAFDPSRPGLRRQLADALEDMQDWNAALVERTTIVKILSPDLPTPADLHALANCALHAGQPGQAAEACQQALGFDTEDGMAHILLGEALSDLGDQESAQEHLTKATQLVPQLAGSWLGLARIQKEAGKTSLALETLRAGAQSAPDSPEIYLALGDAFQNDWEGLGHPSPTQALHMYQQAANWFVKESTHRRSVSILGTQIALRLGQTLHQLGRLDEARQALEQAYQEIPSYPGLAYAYAQTLLTLKEFHTAVPVLEQVLHEHPDNPAPYLDYARALLSISEKPGQAVQALQTVLEKTPDHAEAQALLAEALAASADFPAALQAFQKALETDLVADAVWSSRLSLGLGQVSLALHHPEIAIAALQEAGQADPLNPRISATLAEAYLAAGLFEDALQSARSALSLASEDLETLVWFGGKAVELIQRDQDPESGLNESTRAQVRQEAINAYQRALQLAPGRADLLVSLGSVLWQAGDEKAALEAFHQVIFAENPSVDDLHQAAKSLLDLGDAHDAVACLEKALHIDPDLAFDASTPDSLAFTLVKAYQKGGNPQAALSMLEQALAFSAKDTSLFPLKADLLLELNQPEKALSTLQEALKMETSTRTLLDFRYQAALLKRFNGDMEGALADAEQILVATQSILMDPWRLAAQSLAADIYRSILQPGKSCSYLESFTIASEPGNETQENEKAVAFTESLYDFLCLRAELALDSGDDLVAASIVEASLSNLEGAKDTGRQARLLSIRSRLANHQGDSETGINMLNQALTAVGMKGDQSRIPAGRVSLAWLTYLYRTLIPALLSLSEAALELHQWATALNLLQSLTELANQEALPHLQLARVLTLKAETQHLYESIEVVTHAPGMDALSENTWQTFEAAISAAVHRLDPSAPGKAEITRWNVRGQAIFKPSPESALGLVSLAVLPPLPDDLAAQIAILGEIDQTGGEFNGSLSVSPKTLAIQAAQEYPHHPLVLAQLALMLMTSPECLADALSAAEAAVKFQLSPDHKADSSKSTQYTPLTPAVSHALLACVARQAGEQAVASQAIHTALSFWDDEPRWHSLAAGISLSVGEMTPAIAHLEKAVSLEAAYLPHYLSLGEVYLAKSQEDPGYAPRAIHLLEKACELAPDQASAWLMLAQSYKQSQDLDNAVRCCEQAILLAPDKARPLIYRAEIALEAGEPRLAYSRLEAALKIQEADPSQASDLTSKNSTVVLLMARALDQLGRPAEALKILEKALSDSKNPLPLQMERVQLLRRARGLEAATQALQDLADQYPDEPVVLACLAQSLEETGQVELAIRTAQRALQTALLQAAADPLHQSINAREQAEMHLLLGRLLRQSGQLDQSLHHLDQAIQLAPEMLEPHLELGHTLQDRRQHQQAIQAYNQAALIAPKDPRSYFQAGLALKETKDYIAAESMFRRAAALAPGDVSIHRQLAAVVALNLVHNRRKATVNDPAVEDL